MHTFITTSYEFHSVIKVTITLFPYFSLGSCIELQDITYSSIPTLMSMKKIINTDKLKALIDYVPICYYFSQ